MTVSPKHINDDEKSRPEWLLLLFTLPASQASKRVEVWRKLKRYGALSFRSSGYLLPNTPSNHERFEWLSAAIRKYKGEASVVALFSIDDLPAAELKQLFVNARSKDYEVLLRDLKKKSSSPNLVRMRRRLQDIADVDFFGSPLRARVETALAALESPQTVQKRSPKRGKQEFQRRTWVTRPRPGIDRVSSAWLICNHIDLDAKFAFTNDVREIPNGVPFDMFNVGGFTHQGEKCTFETICSEFGLGDRRLKRLGEIIHDADLNDEKYGRNEGMGLDRVLDGWANLGLKDEELLRRGIELIEGLYRGLS
jgi:disulfide oxidoreductase YuzD